jgi:hypothetical protein
MVKVGGEMTVIFPNGDVGTVPTDILDKSIRERKIIAFLRSSGWVQVDRDPIRLTQRPSTNSVSRDGKCISKRTLH